MERKVIAILKLQLGSGWATPTPPVGPALGQHGVKIGLFCQRFNDESLRMYDYGILVSVVIKVFDDKSFEFKIRSPNTVSLLKQAADIYKGSGQPNKEKVGSITREQLKKIAETKLPDLGTKNIEAAMRTIEGTAKSMGITIKD